jgi:hypothetical protein
MVWTALIQLSMEALENAVNLSSSGAISFSITTLLNELVKCNANRGKAGTGVQHNNCRSTP